MEIKTSVFKRAARLKATRQVGSDGQPKKLKVRGGWIYRLRYVDQDGKPCTRERGFFALKSQARDAMNIAVAELTKTGGNIRGGERMTFNQLTDLCEKAFYKPAVIRNGEKISGVRSLKPVQSHIKHLREYFGPRLISAITPQSLMDYRDKRMEPQPAKAPGGELIQLKIATIHRELSVMRRMMRHAHRNEWVIRDVFYNAEGLFKISLEPSRNRILTDAEESRLIAACDADWTRTYTRTRHGKTEQITATYTSEVPHLKAAIYLALDSALRRGEIIKLAWNDIDFENGLIRILSSNTKTEKPRIVPLSDRSARVLEQLRITSAIRPFPFTDMKSAFARVKEIAGIEDLHFHDLRATAGDRMSKKYTLSTVAKIMGHQRIETTQKHYVGNEVDTVLQVKRWLDVTNDQLTSGNGLESQAVN